MAQNDGSSLESNTEKTLEEKRDVVLRMFRDAGCPLWHPGVQGQVIRSSHFFLQSQRVPIGKEILLEQIRKRLAPCCPDLDTHHVISVLVLLDKAACFKDSGRSGISLNSCGLLGDNALPSAYRRYPDFRRRHDQYILNVAAMNSVTLPAHVWAELLYGDEAQAPYINTIFDKANFMQHARKERSLFNIKSSQGRIFPLSKDPAVHPAYRLGNEENQMQPHRPEAFANAYREEAEDSDKDVIVIEKKPVEKIASIVSGTNSYEASQSEEFVEATPVYAPQTTIGSVRPTVCVANQGIAPSLCTPVMRPSLEAYFDFDAPPRDMQPVASMDPQWASKCDQFLNKISQPGKRSRGGEDYEDANDSDIVEIGRIEPHRKHHSCSRSDSPRRHKRRRSHRARKSDHRKRRRRGPDGRDRKRRSSHRQSGGSRSPARRSRSRDGRHRSPPAKSSRSSRHRRKHKRRRAPQRSPSMDDCFAPSREQFEQRHRQGFLGDGASSSYLHHCRQGSPRLGSAHRYADSPDQSTRDSRAHYGNSRSRSRSAGSTSSRTTTSSDSRRSVPINAGKRQRSERESVTAADDCIIILDKLTEKIVPPGGAVMSHQGVGHPSIASSQSSSSMERSVVQKLFSAVSMEILSGNSQRANELLQLYALLKNAQLSGDFSPLIQGRMTNQRGPEVGVPGGPHLSDLRRVVDDHISHAESSCAPRVRKAVKELMQKGAKTEQRAIEHDLVADAANNVLATCGEGSQLGSMVTDLLRHYQI